MTQEEKQLSNLMKQRRCLEILLNQSKYNILTITQTDPQTREDLEIKITMEELNQLLKKKQKAVSKELKRFI